MSGATHPHFNESVFVIRKKFFKFLGAAFHIYSTQEKLLFYSKLKAFKLKEDIRLYADEGMQQELLVISARQVLDISAAYDVVDPASGARVGTVQRRGMKSILRDEWDILDAEGNEIAKIMEDSTALALVRRFVDMATIFLPQKYHIEMAGQTVATFKQHFNPIVQKITADFTGAPPVLDRRLGIAALVLVCAIEGRQG